MSSSDTRLVYIGSFTPPGGTGSGITLARQTVFTGEMSVVDLVAESASPAFLAWHPSGQFLYAVNEVGEGAVSAYAVAADGSLSFLNTQPTGANGPCHLTVHPTGRFLLTANYGSGAVTVHPIASSGELGDRTDLVQHKGSGPNASRQEGPHAHHVRVDPSGAHVLAVDLGIDAVLTYMFDLDKGTLTNGSVAHTEPGAGPRHLAFAPDGHVHVANELDSTVTTFLLDPASGALAPTGVTSSLKQQPAPDDNYPSEIGISEDGRFLYVANRGLDVIGVLAVEGAVVRPVADVPTGGAWPRHLAVFGGHLYVANERSHQVTHFSLSTETGIPTQVGEIAVPSPGCILPALV